LVYYAHEKTLLIFLAGFYFFLIQAASEMALTALMNLMIRIIFMIPALVFYGIFVASQSLHPKNIWQQERNKLIIIMGHLKKKK